MMQPDVNYNPYNPTQNRTLRGPRPIEQQRSIPQWSKFPKREPRMPISVVVPTKKFVPPTSPTMNYVYPPPKPKMVRQESKTEILLNEDRHFSLPKPSSSTKTIDEEEDHVEVTLPPKPPIQKKKLPPRPVPVAKKPVVCYSSDDNEEEDDINDEEILREFKLSRKKSVHDITISDEEEEEEKEEEEELETIIPLPKTPNKTRQPDLPPVPKVSSPSYNRQPTTTTNKSNYTKPIPTISAPGYSSDEDDTPTIPTICVPGGFSDDEDIEPTPQEKKKSSILNPLYFGVRCGGCDEPLSGQAISTSGIPWHTRCFKCQTCKQNLEHIAFYEMDGLPYCALDYHENFSPRCDFCKTPIEEHSISALGKTYHAGHFFCRECGKPFDEETNFLEHDGHAYCEKDYYKQFGKSCKGCEEIITGDFLVALGGEWHKECFVCADCGGTFNSSTFLIKGGKPYCEEHYNKQRSSVAQKNLPPSLLNNKKKDMPIISVPKTKLDLLPDILPKANSNKNIRVSDDEDGNEVDRKCRKCDKEIQGRFLSAFGYDYHPLHFQCSQCSKLLSARVTGLYQEGENSELICKPCVRRSKLIKS